MRSSVQKRKLETCAEKEIREMKSSVLRKRDYINKNGGDIREKKAIS